MRADKELTSKLLSLAISELEDKYNSPELELLMVAFGETNRSIYKNFKYTPTKEEYSKMLKPLKKDDIDEVHTKIGESIEVYFFFGSDSKVIEYEITYKETHLGPIIASCVIKLDEGLQVETNFDTV